ncbi:hypothetical protein MLOOGBEN_18620 [Bacillus sp. EB106-08-02-XG196]|uniref:hypothetical protein n=1 Tax=Bacillus sp. EB106-08-02-XG196 TaxID=2737049 RepID=UPI0015C4D993|nr:hypothetical protein [Bacillus sp. EB106-08-02-XG196]NWQ42720.1 hypothetical protein [Bacillus sp. EB106-08-02-XG196]
MHSIVINFGKKYEDWHLVEPFFYKLQNNNELTFYWEEEAPTSNPLFLPLVETMIEHLDRHRIKDWQLIILLNLDDELNRVLRLTTHLSKIRKDLLDPLKDKGFYPTQSILHLVDMIKRTSNYAPIEEGLKRNWELDHYGYLLKSNDWPIVGNAFCEEEINQLDEEWGEPIQLQDIILDQPGAEFMEALELKCERVTTCLAKKIDKKKDLLLLRREKMSKDEWMYKGQLDIIMEDFEKKIKQIRTLPLTPSLTFFTPSREISSSLKFHVGIQSEIGDIRLIRQEIVRSSHRERMKGYMELAYYLLTISQHPNLIERLDKGSTSVIQISLENERLETLLNHYFKSLVTAKRQLEDQFLLQNQFHTSRFRDDDFPPYSAASIEKRRDVHQLLSARSKITYQFYDQWEDQLYIAETILLNRENELLENSREAIRKLNVLKRRNDFLEEEETIEINDYKQDILQKIGVVQRDVIHSAPGISEAISKWKSFVTHAKKQMHFLLQLLPNQRQFLMMSILTFIILFIPFLHLLWSNESAEVPAYFYGIVFVVTLLVTYCGYFFTQRISYFHIWKFQEQTYEYTENIYQMQVEAQHKYNDYLNHLFKLFSLRKYLDKLSLLGEKKKEENLLYRYHLVKLDEFVQRTNRLLHILQMNKGPISTEHEIRVPEIKFEKSIIENPIYSPFQQLGVQGSNGHRIEVYLGSAIEQYQSTFINELDQIRVQDDKVYKL